jgi:serine/threonine-protein kinase HipA
MSFAYLPEAKRAISLGMPLGQERFEHTHCEAFFGGLLPESEETRKALAREFRISATNSFALLRAIGRDCAGAISLHELDEPVVAEEDLPRNLRVLDEEELAERIRALPTRPLFVDPGEGVRLSLAGAQRKAVLCIEDGQYSLPQHGTPSTHILKPAISGMESNVLNEYFCLRLARRLNLPTVEATLGQAREQKYLLVKRYDRRARTAGIWQRIHQEDFCQALGIVSSRKYQNEGGPSLLDCFRLLEKSSQPAADRLNFARYLVFNYLLGNGDAHGKNYSLLHGDNTIRLAPLYDIVCTAVYPDLDQRMAMKIGRHYEPDRVQAYHWEELCKQNKLSYPQMKRYILTLCQRLPEVARLEFDALNRQGLDTGIAARIVEFISRRALDVERKFELATSLETGNPLVND